AGGDGAAAEAGGSPDGGGSSPDADGDGASAQDAPLSTGGPRRGLPPAAVCGTLHAPPASRGRARELDARRCGARRAAPPGPAGPGGAFPVGGAAISGCRAGVASLVFPDEDTLVCDPTADLQSPHLLTAVASQNYGSNSYRVRQPFDFAGRTGTIVFDGTV